jgi:hypothetical protein
MYIDGQLAIYIENWNALLLFLSVDGHTSEAAKDAVEPGAEPGGGLQHKSGLVNYT